MSSVWRVLLVFAVSAAISALRIVLQIVTAAMLSGNNCSAHNALNPAFSAVKCKGCEG